MKLNPITTYKNITLSYKNYLKTLFFSRNKNLNQKLSKLIDETEFTKGPFVELTRKFKEGKSIKEYIDRGMLHKDIEKILKPYELKNLYFHQQKVIENSVIKNKNIIISTGTGSGKTLSFLIPVINHILNHQNQSGVKALFLYPMNALANDQLKDLRKRLKNLPNVSFGRYTGETEYKKDDAIENYRKQNIEILDNERKSREEILTNPPDILITNYSMLEFLLLRPRDSVLFGDNSWKYIVLDEIHTYDGAKGSEIGYLLRRLKDRVFKNHSPLCIGASATLGDKDKNKEVAKFAQAIFDENFEEDSIIRAEYKDYKIIQNNLWKLNFSIKELSQNIEKIKDIKELIKKLKEYKEDFDSKSHSKEEILYQFLENNFEVNKIKELLLKEPLTIQNLSKKLKISEDDLAALIELSLKAKKDGEELLYAKYHFFVKAADGLYAALKEDGEIEEIFFDKKIKHNGKKVFELSSCKNCGEIFLTGAINRKRNSLEIDEGDETDILRLNKSKRVYLSKPLDINYDEDESEKLKDKILYLNIKTGEVSRKPKDGFLEFLEIETMNEIDSIKCCPNCGKCARKNLSPINYRFVTGDEFPQSILLTSLYASMPSNRKKTLVFSDSRRDAAFFAPFFERIYNDAINRKKLIYFLNRENREIYFEEMVNDYLYNQFKDKKKREYENLLINEFSLKDSKSLENIGLIKWTLKREIEDEMLNRELNRVLYQYSLTKDEIKALIYILLLTMRESFAIDAEANVAEALNLGFSTTPAFKKKSDGNYKGWIGNNKRVQFLSKVLNVSKKDAKEILGIIWDSLTSTNIFSSDKGAKRLKIDNWKISLNNKIYRCDRCGKIHIWNVKNSCRVFNCNGKLYEIDKNDIGEAKYYISLYESGKNSSYKELQQEAKMIIEEHTAQLENKKAQEIQKRFEEGRINILSCSTTFELGVDIGTLESVFLHNVPPRADNYIQRAGRAGRSGDSAAFILTFANRRAHDMKYFENPIPLVKGEMKTPVISIENIRIIRRHLNALALSYFLRKKFFGVNRIILKDFLEIDGFKEFKNYIYSKPKELKESIKNILSKELYNQMGIENWEWIKDVEDEKYEGCLDLWEKIESEIEKDMDEYLKLKEKYVNEENYKEADKIKKILKYYEDIDIITLFSQKIFIPKYGFPVDTISLDTKKIGLKDISLDRDMSIALREYAPDENVIASKKLIISGNMKIISGKMPQIVKFFFCSRCGYFEEGIDLRYPSNCPNCNSKIRSSNSLEYIVPIFGFEAKKYEDKIPIRKPIPKSKVRSFYIGGEKELNRKRFSNLELIAAKRGRITSINIDSKINTSNGKIGNNYSKTRLGYHFYTDVLIIENLNIGNDLTKNYSLLYALLEGASRALDIKREDINATLVPNSQSSYKIVLYDNVPAGAGFMQEIYKRFDEVVKSAIDIVKNCKCDKESCCPVCLEHISNQYLINFIKRGVALEILENFKL